MSDLIDLVCGPAGPLPETHQRYRLVQHLGSGGQAEVYRAVRVCSGVSSAPMTVKVFRIDPLRPIADELRSWDKGDAALMDLNNRGVPGICRRADGFWGPPPHPPGQLPPPGDAVPIQVYDYLPGVNLREYVHLSQRTPAGQASTGRSGGALGGTASGGGARRLDAQSTLTFLAKILNDLHHPADPSACPVLHMDIKPANVMVLPSGEIKLIDFTGARYHRTDHITQIAYTAEAGGPEAFSGEVGPAYDVHGFGAVAYYLVTGMFPRGDTTAPGAPGAATPPWATLRSHPMLEARPELRTHLLAPLADAPNDRPGTVRLARWVAELGDLVRSSDCPDNGVDWLEAAEPGRTKEMAADSRGRMVGRASVTVNQPVAGTDTGAFARIEKLERELVQLRSVVAAPAVPTQTPTYAVPPLPQTQLLSNTQSQHTQPISHAPTQPMSQAQNQPMSHAPTQPMVNASRTQLMPHPQAEAAGRSAVPRPDGPHPGAAWPGNPHHPQSVPGPPSQPRQRHREPPLAPKDRATVLLRGWEFSAVGAALAFVCWGVWAFVGGMQGLGARFAAFLFVLIVAGGLFMLCRLLGLVVIVRGFSRTRKTARVSHLAVGVFLAFAGMQYLDNAGWLGRLFG